MAEWLRIYSKYIKHSRQQLRPTKVLLQAGQDVVIFGCSSLSASVPAGQAPLGFCSLSFTFISLFSSGWGQTQQWIPCYRGRYTPPPRLVSAPTCSNVKAVTKNVENNLTKNAVNLPNHIHLMWQVDYTFSGGILTQAVFGGDTDHGGNTT